MGWGERDNCKLDVLYFLAYRQTVTKLIFVVFCCCYSYVSLSCYVCVLLKKKYTSGSNAIYKAVSGGSMLGFIIQGPAG